MKLYLLFLALILTMMTCVASTTFYHYDGNNVSSLVNNQGQIVGKYTYDPYGNTVSKAGAMSSINTYRFSSKEIQPTSGLYAYKYRFYNPPINRWINSDPIGLSGGRNAYAFVGNDPINEYDPTGLDDNDNSWFENRLNHIQNTFNFWVGYPLAVGLDEWGWILTQPAVQDFNDAIMASPAGVPERAAEAGILGGAILTEEMMSKLSAIISDATKVATGDWPWIRLVKCPLFVKKFDPSALVKIASDRPPEDVLVNGFKSGASMFPDLPVDWNVGHHMFGLHDYGSVSPYITFSDPMRDWPIEIGGEFNNMWIYEANLKQGISLEPLHQYFPKFAAQKAILGIGEMPASDIEMGIHNLTKEMKFKDSCGNVVHGGYDK